MDVDTEMAVLEAKFIALTIERIDALRAEDKARVGLCDIRISFVLQRRIDLKHERPLIDA